MFNNLGNIFKHVSFAKEGSATYPIEHEPSALYFTQAELQQIKEVLRNQLASEENYSKVLQCAARNAKSDGHKETASMYYKDLSKSKKKIKALSAIQAKVKHSILTLG